MAVRWRFGRYIDRGNVLKLRIGAYLLPICSSFSPGARNSNLYLKPSYCCGRRLHSAKHGFSLEDYDTNRVRNFCIIAHIDHGKSTIADRLLEHTGTIERKSNNKQVFDKLPVERERGITVKAQTASMFYDHGGEKLLLNLIDTPGHVDFNYEVSRSFAACQGALLVIDAAQGIQAQTVANYNLAKAQGLFIIPVINKIDLPTADPEKVGRSMQSYFGIPADDIILTSAKTGFGIDTILQAVCDQLPRPSGKRQNPLSTLLIDSWYDKFKGVICQISVKSGLLKQGDLFESSNSGKSYEALEVGILSPDQVSTRALYTGQVGYIVLGMKDTKEALIGDTFFHVNQPVIPFPGFWQSKSMVFSGMYPVDQNQYSLMRKALEKLTLNDSSVSFHPDYSQALGQGWRMGFLGLLHMDVFRQRIEQEYHVEVIVTTPNVPYRAKLKNKEEVVEIISPSDLPDHSKVDYFEEPVVVGTIICPEDYIGKVMTMCENKRGTQLDFNLMEQRRALFKYKLPLSEVVLDFFDDLKSISSVYASFDYEDGGYEPTEIEKLEIMLNGKIVDSLTFVVHRSQARGIGKLLCFKLKNSIERQLFEVVIQAAIRNKVIARETIQPYRKNVLAKCYGGDITRKRKLLDRQKEGKKAMKEIGNVEIPTSAFAALLKR